MKIVKIPMAEVMNLIVNPDDARINSDDTQMLAIIEDQLVVFEGDFKGIDADDVDLAEILKRNL